MTAQQDAIEALVRFYDALHGLVTGGGLDAMDAAWHHIPEASTSHPMGEWAYGWDEVRATWEALTQFPPQKGIPKATLKDVRAHAVGDLAFTTCVYQAGAPGAPGRVLALNCTNVLQRMNGQWKVVHHHVDKSPELDKMLASLA